MKGSYMSPPTPLFASETNMFRMELVLGSTVQSLEEIDIDVVVYTAQMSPRMHVKSIYAEWISGQTQAEEAYISRTSDSFTLVLTPAFLEQLPTGILTFAVTYTKGRMRVTNVMATEKFINNVISPCHASVR